MRFLADSDTFSYFDNNAYAIAPNRYELLAGKGVVSADDTIDIASDWRMGHRCFEAGDQRAADSEGFEPQATYTPHTVIFIAFQSSELTIETYEKDVDSVLQAILDAPPIPPFVMDTPQASFHTPISKEAYLQTLAQIKADIYVGKYYEINYCIPYYLDDIQLDPIALFHYQNQLNPSPMAVCYRQGADYLICTSPERFLFTAGPSIYAQPIKGTAPKTKIGWTEAQLQQALAASEKDKAENVMIVDLTRSELAKCCAINTVRVPELFGIYTFPYVFQMISTISGSLEADMDFHKILSHTFPMGSMTGAPKPTVIRHIQQYESVDRGLYSGTVFYIQPDEDFDSNVVIRSLLYHSTQHRLQFHVGGAITYDSIAEQEWEELSWKALSMKKVLQNPPPHNS